MRNRLNNLNSDFGGKVNMVEFDTTVFKDGIDFNSAVKISGFGSTCEIYRTRIGGRHVFVKRLKDKYIGNPLYMQAFRKEYEIGSSLIHRCLPVFVNFTEEYLTMNYIDGQTLADLIEKKDKWLTEKENVRKMLKDLLDVVSYLHDRNVVHCDIKEDNIMLTYGSRNLFLIDFDKCYTSWFDNTAGASERFELPEETRKLPMMDYRGIGKIIDTLEDKIPGFPFIYFEEFRKECDSPNVSFSKLSRILGKKEINPSEKSRRRRFKELVQEVFRMTGMLVISAFSLGLILSMCSSESPSLKKKPKTETENTQKENPEIVKLSPDFLSHQRSIVLTLI